MTTVRWGRLLTALSLHEDAYYRIQVRVRRGQSLVDAMKEYEAGAERMRLRTNPPEEEHHG